MEKDATAAETFAINHPESEVILEDIRKITATRILAAANMSIGELDLLTGCPPCQGFSTLRTRQKSSSVFDPRNDLLFDFLRLIRSLRPRAVIFENVPGLAKDWRFGDFERKLKSAGYGTAVSILDAADYGVPQRRRRLVMVAYRGATPAIDWVGLREKKATVEEAIKHLELPGQSGDELHDYPDKRSSSVLERIRATPKDGGSRSDIAAKFQCKCHGKTTGFRDVYGRMAWKAVAPTITSGCNNPSKGRFIHPTQDRAITLREAALLQTFPPDYVFPLTKGKGQVAAQIGNAFPPKLIAPVARVVAQRLSNE